ncbi:adenosylcobinamide-GDP ribazoletransferase [Thioclava sp.]|uniref:adenosylcobinamide-GDP ribazoletransferase n=1 Tax=Thioclava sp. TaxID=1933450 RepID=UPI003AA84CD3
MTLREAHLALVLMTRLPLPKLAEPIPKIGSAAWAFPLAGLMVGAITAAVLVGLVALGLSAALAAGGALGVQIMLTGALHEDGLADFTDGIWGGQDHARRLEIMRDSRIGTYGALALILSVGLRWQALAVLALHPAIATLAIIVIAMTSRACVTVALTALPSARTDGMGHSASGTSTLSAFIAMALGGVSALVLALTTGSPASQLLVPAQALVLFALSRLSLRRLGGQTGDVLGAAQQLTEITGFLVLSACLVS